jgi:hypothetical protein
MVDIGAAPAKSLAQGRAERRDAASVSLATAAEVLLKNLVTGGRHRYLDAAGNAPLRADVQAGLASGSIRDKARNWQAFAAQPERKVEADLVILDRHADALRGYLQRAVIERRVVS